MNENNDNVNTYSEVKVNSDSVLNEGDLNEQLTALRELTKLNPIEYLKLEKARMQAEKLRDLYIKYEPNDIIDVDYSTANDLELELRRNALSRSLERDWKKYLSVENDGYGLSQYTDDVLNEKIKENRRKRQK